MAAKADTVRLVPTGTAYIPGVPAVECEVSAEEAERLLAYRPAAFTRAGAAPVATTVPPAAPAEPAVVPDDDPAAEPKE